MRRRCGRAHFLVHLILEQALLARHEAAIAFRIDPGVDAFGGDADVTSNNVATLGDSSQGIVAIADSGSVSVTSGTVTTAGNNSGGIVADADTNALVDSGTVTTSGTNSIGIAVSAYYGYIDVQSTSVTTTGANSGGILAITGGPTNGGADIYIDSGSVATSGVGSSGILAIAGTLFWFLVRVMARIQLPTRRPEERVG